MRALLSGVHSACVILLGLTAALSVSAQGAPQQSFSDVPAKHPAYAAAEYLKEKGVLSGYSDGTFKPKNKVNRAEAVKILAASLVSEDDLKAAEPPAYSDVAAGAWYAPYVSLAASKLSIIDAPSKTATFAPTRTVKRAEFLKMLFSAKHVDYVHSYSELTPALSADVRTATDWYFPVMRYALSASVISVQSDGTLRPGEELTRADVAQMLYYYEMYTQNRRAQALLSQTEADLVNVLKMLEARQIDQAELASARAVVSARGALAIRPDAAIVKGAMKTAEGFKILVFAYRSGLEGKLDDAVKLAGDAWHLAAKATDFSSDLQSISTQMQTIAKNLADEARARMPK